MDQQFKVVIVGGGTGGITVAARLRRARPELEIAIIEPATKHYYQPLWTLVGGGAARRESTEREMADVIPKGVTWIRDYVEGFEPEANALTTRSGARIGYEFLVVAPGIQIDWGAIDGLEEALGHDGVCSNYSYEFVNSTWAAIQATGDGNAIFTYPNTPIKCGGAPQKIMWLAEHHFRRAGVRERINVIFASAGASIFGVPKYRDALQKLVEERGIDTRFRHNLVALRPGSREAVFQRLDNDEEVILKYSMIHVAPPMSAPEFVRRSPLANAAGWVEVDKSTTQHVRYSNVFALGDASSLPTSKTGAAIRKQAPVTVEALLAVMDGRAPQGGYDGYTSCPLVTGYGRLILAEFDYDGKPAETFPFDQSKERLSMYLLKKYALPQMYWRGMLRGVA
ncbi:MAG: NAD(P)/FAD-dependent oxidoreductase [Myxococcales bacterium]|nr:NAD(P)/FAD-dependent oxidoreductase [Myxococcales bacterium]